MNFQQLEYIIAVDHYRHFVTAAEKCFVTQATLSTMIKKLEEELDIKIFDRSKQPVMPTSLGIKIIEQAKVIVKESQKIREMIDQEKGILSGELKLGVIPTLAPYLLPLFINSFIKNYPLVKLKISELTTGEIVRQLEKDHLDVGILATPLNNPNLIEDPLFYEQFVVYSSEKEKLLKKKYLLASDIDVNRLWLLEEGHCLRSQVVNLCELREKEKKGNTLEFEAGSIETLRNIVEANQGITILPELALRELDRRQQKNIRFFKSPAPVREISIVTYRLFVKDRLARALREEILCNIPQTLKTDRKKEVIEIF